MRVAVVIEQCWHQVPGGTARSVIQQLEAVAALSADATAERDRVQQVGVAAYHRQPPAEPWVPPIPVRQLPLPRRALYETWHRFGWPKVERATGPVDLIHATGYAVPPRTVPLVVTLHDLAWRRDAGHFTRHGARFFEAALARTRDLADLVICPSQATYRDCVEAGIEPSRLRHIPWGVSSSVAEDGSVEAVRERYGLTGRYILSVGTREPRKNLGRLVDAFRQLPQEDVTLAIVGPEGWGAGLGEEQQLGAGPGRVRLLGFVPGDDLPSLYRGASVVAYPSLWEGFGLPVAEALAQGTPVVTSAGTATEELVAGGAGVAVDPYDTDAIADALVAVLNDDAWAQQLSAAASVRAAELTWESTARQTLDAYRSVLAGAGPER